MHGIYKQLSIKRHAIKKERERENIKPETKRDRGGWREGDRER